MLGSPVGHSLSPALHRAAYAALGLTWWRYEAVECDEAGLPALLDRCGPDWAGMSLTMPLKRAVLPLLDRIEPLAAQVGAANTVVFAAAQRLGYNTDAPGLARALREHGADGAAAAGRPVIVGGGATACAALAALAELGARSAAVTVRDTSRAGAVRAAAGRLGMDVLVRPLGEAALAGARLVISTVPAGAGDALASLLAGLPAAPGVLFDVVYDPWPTPLAKAGSAAGAVVIGGFDLLLHQAALQVELMTGRPAPVAEMRRAGLAELDARALHDRGRQSGGAAS